LKCEHPYPHPVAASSYTHEETTVRATGASVGELLADLEQHYSGIRFRIIN
jgi:hypothetical protein